MIAACVAIGVIVWNRPVLQESLPPYVEPSMAAGGWTGSNRVHDTTPRSLNGDPYTTEWVDGKIPKAAHFQLDSAVPIKLIRDDF
jgi:hypothetical protein